MATEARERGAPAERRNRGDEVLQAAIEIFHDKGYASASIQDVADRVGVLKGSLYHYIDSKEDLLARIFEESNKQSVAIMEDVVARDLGAVERLHEFSRLWSLWFLENVERSSLYFNQWKHLTGERLEEVKARRHDYEAGVARMIDDVKAEGKAAKGLDTRYACFFALSAISGLPVWFKRDGSDPADHIAAIYADMIVSMVCNTEGRRRPPKKRSKRSKSS